MTDYISYKIKQIMKEKGMGNKALSDASGLPLGTLNKIIYGDTKSPTLDNMQAIANALGCTIDDFVEDYADKSYYTDPATSQLAQEISETPGLRALFSAARDVSAEDLQLVIDMISKFKKETE